MSRYVVDKFLFTVDRDPELIARYRHDPAGTVEWWERERANEVLGATGAEATTWCSLTDGERRALAAHDHVALFELGAHPFLTFALWRAMFERDYDEPLAMQRDYAARLSHFSLPYPDIAT